MSSMKTAILNGSSSAFIGFGSISLSILAALPPFATALEYASISSYVALAMPSSYSLLISRFVYANWSGS